MTTMQGHPTMTTMTTAPKRDASMLIPARRAKVVPVAPLRRFAMCVHAAVLPRLPHLAACTALLVLAGCSILGGKPKDPTTVSYTHLTLPTKRIV